jgi:hypothetical protein
MWSPRPKDYEFFSVARPIVPDRRVDKNMWGRRFFIGQSILGTSIAYVKEISMTS